MEDLITGTDNEWKRELEDVFTFGWFCLFYNKMTTHMNQGMVDIFRIVLRSRTDQFANLQAKRVVNESEYANELRGVFKHLTKEHSVIDNLDRYLKRKERKFKKKKTPPTEGQLQALAKDLVEYRNVFEGLSNQVDRYVEEGRVGWRAEKQIALNELNLCDKSYENLSELLNQQDVAYLTERVVKTVQKRLSQEAKTSKGFMGLPPIGWKRRPPRIRE